MIYVVLTLAFGLVSALLVTFAAWLVYRSAPRIEPPSYAVGFGTDDEGPLL